MDRIKHLLIFAILFANSPFAVAQTAVTDNSKALTTAVGETLFLHTNSTTFLSGETLYCKLYCLNPQHQPSAISKIAYAELVDNTRKSVFKQKLYIENGTAQGDLFIPTTLKTGNYKLIVYTKWMLNHTASALFEMDITIINPFQPLESGNQQKDSIVTKTVTSNEIAKISSDYLTVETDNKSYASREKVSLKIKKTAANIPNGNYSVSVRKMDGLPLKNQITAAEFAKIDTPRSTAQKIIYLPELRGELVSGSIASTKGVKDLSHKTVALSVVGRSFALKIAETDRQGKFTFILDKHPNLSNAVIQVLDDNWNDYSISLDDVQNVDLSTLHFLPEFAIGADLKSSIEQRSIANQIENAYYEKKKDSIVADLTSASFFHSIEKEYILDDYTRFPTMKETITEVILEMYFKKTNGKYSVHLRNAFINNEQYGAPLLMVDGLVIQDANELFNYNTENIYKISLINEPYIYGPKTFGGVINITTKNQDYQLKASGDFIKNVSLSRPLNRKNYFQPNYATRNTSSRIPDYRYQLLWLPQLTVNETENLVSFYTSDVPGEFEIVVEGFTETGIPISIKDHFEVK